MSTEAATDQALRALALVDFDWTVRTATVWRDPRSDVPAIHAGVRDEILADLSRLERRVPLEETALGHVILGPAGAGKTHLLACLRRDALARGAFFLLCDMTDVNDFWETARLGILQSLDQPLAGGERQIDRLVSSLFASVEVDLDTWLSEAQGDSLARRLHMAVRRLRPPAEHEDTIQALLLFSCEDPALYELGRSWLFGLGLERSEQTDTELGGATASASQIFRGICWALARVAPTLLAFDQLDAIVMHSHLQERSGAEDPDDPEANRARAIINGVANGLMAVVDHTVGLQPVVGCLEETWHRLQENSQRSFEGRYRDPEPIGAVASADRALELVSSRLGPAWAAAGFDPPYPSWPFPKPAFTTASTLMPRELLRACDRHLRRSLRAGRVDELEDFSGAPAAARAPAASALEDDAIASRFTQLKAQADRSALLERDTDTDAFRDVLGAFLRALLLQEAHCFDARRDGLIDQEFPGQKIRPLDVRLRVVDHAAGDREQHVALLGLQRGNARAFQNRLQAATTAAGIDRDLGFRKLVVLRTAPLPGGPKTAELIDRFREAGGVFHAPEEEELDALVALHALLAEGPEGLDSWLAAARPLRSWALYAHVRDVLPRPLDDTDDAPGPPQERPSAATTAVDGSRLPIGRELAGSEQGPTIDLPLADLRRHAVIFGGAGSGKSVLLRRLVEEAALRGVPALVIDGANDLSQLGTAWAEAPEGWGPGDAELAEAYLSGSETVVWTPGREDGNPLRLEPLPDLAALRDDPNELQQAVELALSALGPVVADGRSQSANKKRGVLASALRAFAQFDTSGLEAFIAFLAELPDGAGGDISNARKIGAELADGLRAERAQNPLLRQGGQSLDPGLLFGTGARRTRISVVSLVGLPSLGAQQTFVGQLATTLFSWMKKHPTPSDRALGGLVVIDEAKDLVPSGENVASRAPLTRLAAQARKYGFGLVFATQTPRSIDHNVVANCSTQFYGKMSSPAAINTIKDLMRARGGDGADIGRLERGRFYAHGEGFPAPRKVATPMCLSFHPASPPTEEAVLELARSGRSAVAGPDPGASG